MKYKKGDCFKSISYNSDGTGEGNFVIEIKEEDSFLSGAYYINFIESPVGCAGRILKTLDHPLILMETTAGG